MRNNASFSLTYIYIACDILLINLKDFNKSSAI